MEYNKSISIASFGAIRPLKNQLLQAMAAMKFCEVNNVLLHFYINANRLEQGGEAVIKNIRALFKGSKHTLHEIKWATHEEFKKIIAEMDLGMQVSHSESFNVVTADFVDMGVPIVVSSDIDWVSPESVADCNSLNDIVEKMEFVLNHRHRIVHENRVLLNKHNHRSLMFYWFLRNTHTNG